jgi:two-component system, chemotaxis family, CheB/CheR fusion protein
MARKAGSPPTATRESEPAAAVKDNFAVVGIGASAGGLEAFTDLLRYLPADTGMAFVLVQHLDPRHESILAELLSSKTPMPVLQVTGDTRVEPNRVYIIPPNSEMVISERTLRLQPRSSGIEQFHPIDTFLRSLAQDARANAVGIVLSGTASDGTLGLKAIKQESGITFAQNMSAKFDSMPRSAVAAGAVDFILSPKRIAEELSAISNHSYLQGPSESNLLDAGPVVHRILMLLRSNTGVDFTQYKQATIARRLMRRMVMRKTEKIESYLELLQNDPGETQALFDDLLINVTDFFRDFKVFEAAQAHVFPALLKGRNESEPIRVWVPGCSSGEEVYSIAIGLCEYMDQAGAEFLVQLFGTDVSDGAIAKARAGIYDESSMTNVSPERLRRFFVRVETGYQICRQVREMCIFSKHNIARDPPLSRMDLISCRNLLIYFSPALQKRVISTFGYALQPGGCLVLGTSESLGSLTDYFSTLDEEHRIYRRKTGIPAAAFDLSDLLASYSLHATPSEWTPRIIPSGNQGASAQSKVYIGDMWPSHLAPAGVVVNHKLEIIEIHGETEFFLHSSQDGEKPFLMALLREHLGPPVRAAIAEARTKNIPVRVDNAEVTREGHSRSIQVTAVPLTIPAVDPHLLILFESAVQPAGESNGAAAGGSVSGGSPEASTNVPHLERELASTREYLQSIIEELRSTNEEAQSANEELQSANEELQTAKEELQSANEELNTINAEMQSRNSELGQLNDDLVNLLSSMNMPIVMTGSDLRIRRYTPVAGKVLHLIGADVGRPISDLKPRINVPDLENILRHVLETLIPDEREVQDQEGRWYLMRIRPYRTTDNRIEGAVLQLLDVGDLKRSLEELKLARDYAQAIVDTVREPLVVLDRGFTIQNANSSFYEFADLPSTTALGRSIFEIAHRTLDSPEVHALLNELLERGTQMSDIEFEHESDGENHVMLLNARYLRNGHSSDLILLAFEEITERKRAAEARYRRLFESARDGIVILDATTGEITDMNPFAEHLFAYGRDEIVGRKLWEIEALQNQPRIHTAFEQIGDQGVLTFPDVSVQTKDGRNLQAEVIANVYLDKNGRSIQLNIRDLTERRKFDQELQHTQKLESLGLLAGGIAHDFNNLLTGILGNASLAWSDTPVDQPARKYLREVVSAAERASFLTKQMLAYAGKGRFITQTLDLDELVREISVLIGTSIPKTVEVRMNLRPDLPPIEADPGQIQQVVMNLVINGAEAIGENRTGRVDVTTDLAELTRDDIRSNYAADELSPGRYVRLEVRDNGSGMDEATRARIFDPFFTTKFTGRGLGLAAVLGIVKGHKGTIRVYSAPGHGTSFHVLLPVAKRVAPADVQKRADAGLTRFDGLALVVDDEELIRNLAAAILSRYGFQVLTAENGKVGVELFRQHKDQIRLVLLDLLMPIMGGEETLAQIQAIRADVPVILSSGFDIKEADRRFAGKTLAGFVQKPYSLSSLIDAVRQALPGKEHRATGA